MLLSACEAKKDAEYFYKNIEELKKVGKECEIKVRDASSEDLDKLTTDQLCRDAMTATLAIGLGDLKKALLIEEEKGWKAYLQHEKNRRKKQAELKEMKEQMEKHKKEMEEEQKRQMAEQEAKKQQIEKEKSDYLTQNQNINWRQYLKENEPCYNGHLCDAKNELIKIKRKEAHEEIMNQMSYTDFLGLKKEFCANHLSQLCEVWKYAEYKRQDKEIDYFINLGEKQLVAEYKKCENKVRKYGISNIKRYETAQEYPCDIVLKSAEKFYNQYFGTYERDLPKK